MPSSERLGLLWWLPFGHVAEVPARELQGRLADQHPPQILDVRTRRELTQGHIPGAINLPIHELRGGLVGLGLSTDRAVVAICLSAHRSIPAVRLLRSMGFDAAQLQGGMLAWRREGLPSVQDNAR